METTTIEYNKISKQLRKDLKLDVFNPNDTFTFTLTGDVNRSCQSFNYPSKGVIYDKYWDVDGKEVTLTGDRDKDIDLLRSCVGKMIPIANVTSYGEGNKPIVEPVVFEKKYNHTVTIKGREVNKKKTFEYLRTAPYTSTNPFSANMGTKRFVKEEFANMSARMGVSKALLKADAIKIIGTASQHKVDDWFGRLNLPLLKNTEQNKEYLINWINIDANLETWARLAADSDISTSDLIKKAESLELLVFNTSTSTWELFGSDLNIFSVPFGGDRILELVKFLNSTDEGNSIKVLLESKIVIYEKTKIVENFENTMVAQNEFKQMTELTNEAIENKPQKLHWKQKALLQKESLLKMANDNN